MNAGLIDDEDLDRRMTRHKTHLLIRRPDLCRVVSNVVQGGRIETNSVVPEDRIGRQVIRSTGKDRSVDQSGQALAKGDVEDDRCRLRLSSCLISLEWDLANQMLEAVYRRCIQGANYPFACQRT